MVSRTLSPWRKAMSLAHRSNISPLPVVTSQHSSRPCCVSVARRSTFRPKINSRLHKRSRKIIHMSARISSRNSASMTPIHTSISSGSTESTASLEECVQPPSDVCTTTNGGPFCRNIPLMLVSNASLHRKFSSTQKLPRATF